MAGITNQISSVSQEKVNKSRRLVCREIHDSMERKKLLEMLVKVDEHVGLT